MGALIVIAAGGGVGNWVSLRIWPETSCKRCGGSERNAGSTAKRFGRCKRCDGTGRKPRLGTQILARRR